MNLKFQTSVKVVRLRGCQYVCENESYFPLVQTFTHLFGKTDRKLRLFYQLKKKLSNQIEKCSAITRTMGYISLHYGPFQRF